MAEERQGDFIPCKGCFLCVFRDEQCGICNCFIVGMDGNGRKDPLDFEKIIWAEDAGEAVGNCHIRRFAQYQKIDAAFAVEQPVFGVVFEILCVIPKDYFYCTYGCGMPVGSYFFHMYILFRQ